MKNISNSSGLHIFANITMALFVRPTLCVHLNLQNRKLNYYHSPIES